MARLLFHMALLNSGFNIEDPSDFASSLSKLINTGFGIARDAPIEEIEVEIEDDKKDDEADTEVEEEEEIKLDFDEKENADEPKEEEMQEIPIETSHSEEL